MKIFKNTPQIYLTGLVAAVSLLLSSCLKDNNKVVSVPVALVSVTQASPDAPAMTLSLDNNQVNTIPFAYGDELNYIRAYTGLRHAIFYSGIAPYAQLSTDTVRLNANNIYSLFLANHIANPDYILLKDTLTQPASGKAGIRFVNVSSDSPAVDLAINGGPVLVSNKVYKGRSTFVPLAGNQNYTFEVRKTGTSIVLASLVNVPVNVGALYTLSLQGFAGGTGTQILSLNLFNNAY